MFSPNAKENTRLIDCAFIAGINEENINKYILNPQSDVLVPECMVTFSNTEESISSAVLDFTFPTGITVRYSEETPKFFSLTLTNEKGFRSYIYILKLWQKIEFNDSSSLQNCINKIEIGNEAVSGATNSNSHNFKNKIFDSSYFYLPVVVCLSSSLFHTDNFKEILHEFVKIITYQNIKISHQADYSSNLEKYRYCEIINYFNILGNIIIPPNYSNFRLNFRFSQIDFYMASHLEIPTDGKNSCIQILFECLEISIIIKLWCSILTEKHIIIMANQNFLLFSVCEALMRLIFPLKWLHTYIPLLPDSQIEYLEAPTPYIMGVLSNSICFESLKESFPDHVICNIDTSEIHAENVVKLPQIEETKLRKKLQFVKNPEIFDIEEIITSQNKIMIEDVQPDRSFSDNVQHIFFRIFRNALAGFKAKYMLDSVFYQVDFLNDLGTHSEENRMFWDKIIKTFAFEYFILSNQYLEDSNTKIFKNVIKLRDENLDKEKDCYNLTITLPDDNIEKILREVSSGTFASKGGFKNDENKSIKYPKEINKDIKIYNKFLKEILASQATNEQVEMKMGSQYYVKTEELEESLAQSENNTPAKRKMTTRSHTIKWNNINSLYQPNNNQSDNFVRSYDSSSVRKKTIKFDPIMFNNNNNVNLLSCKFFTSSVKFEKKSDEFSFYKCIFTKRQGFLHYINNVFTMMKNSTTTRSLFELGIKTEIKKILEEKISKKSQLSVNLAKIDEMGEVNNEMEENEINLENNNGTLSSNNLNSNQSTAIDKFFNKSLGAGHTQNSQNSGKNKWVDLSKINKKETLEVEWSDLFQYHIAMAYLLEEFLLTEKEFVEKENLLNIILTHYEKAFVINKKEFPSVRYFQLIDKMDLDHLIDLREKLYEKFPDRRIKRIFSDSDLGENSESHLNSGNIAKTNRLIRIINVKYESSSRRNRKNLSKKSEFSEISKFERKERQKSFEETCKISPRAKIENFNFTSTANNSTKDNSRRASALTAISLKVKENILNTINSKDQKIQLTSAKKTSEYQIFSYSSSKNERRKESFSNFLHSMKNVIREDIKKISKKKKETSCNAPNSNIKTKEKTELNSQDPKNQENTENKKEPNELNNLKIEIPKNTNEENLNLNTLTGTNTKPNTDGSSNLNFLKNIKNYFFGQCDANKIIDRMKKSDHHIKTAVINSYIKYSKSVKDPLVLLEEICRRLIYLFEDFSLDKFNSDVLNTKIIQKVNSSDAFNLLKENVAELQKVNITKFSTNREKISFWLNLFNFLTIFTILYNTEILSTQYEWIRFLKNSVFNIGGYDLNLFEIQNCILSEGDKNFYGGKGDFYKFNQNDIRNKLIIEDKSVFISLAVTLPTKTSPDLRFYYPDNLEENLKINFRKYCIANIVIDLEKESVLISELITNIDKNFVENLDNYKEYYIFNLC